MVATPIVPTDLERCRESEQGRRQIFEVADADIGARGRLCPSGSLLHARRRTRRRKRSASWRYTELTRDARPYHLPGTLTFFDTVFMALRLLESILFK